MKAKVCVVGAGPGDPGLLTLRALEVIRRADVVLYDRLVGKEVLGLIPKRARKVFVGRSPTGKPVVPQSTIDEILVTEARRGKNVVRLKGGDPFIFGRGGEDIEALRKEGVEFEVVPGLTSAAAAPAYAGIPLTDRRYSSSVAIITGHEAESKGVPGVRLGKIASGVDTLVILMGVSTLSRTAKSLIRGGLDRDTPLAAVEWGTTPRQVTTLMTVGEAADGEAKGRLRPPSVIVVGRTAEFAGRLGWFPQGRVRLSRRFKAAWGAETGRPGVKKLGPRP
ncbi:MAG: uroporphyrinogen-III C-methyltransferase [Nitrososphaerota archaeon]|nr:uroporphyrinogen-III C-methyltransferase [Nitrososphaerota archaeon]